MKETEVIYSKWNEYDKKEFRLDGYECILVIPKEAYPGKPWVWRAEFFGEFDYADRALLLKGWHIAYIRISDMYGCPESVEIMQAFYKHMVRAGGLSPRADLFGFSRGGLYAVNYAVKYPDTISTLYLDAPVMDVASWPGGYGEGERFPKEWEECKAVYQLTEEKALEFKDNPINKIDRMLNAGIRIMLVAGDADRIVPYKENGAGLAEYYQKNGGPIKVIVKHGCDHHPHSLKDPAPIVEYIEENYISGLQG